MRCILAVVVFVVVGSVAVGQQFVPNGDVSDVQRYNQWRLLHPSPEAKAKQAAEEASDKAATIGVEGQPVKVWRYREMGFTGQQTPVVISARLVWISPLHVGLKPNKGNERAIFRHWLTPTDQAKISRLYDKAKP
jgi:hypothetical protein